MKKISWISRLSSLVDRQTSLEEGKTLNSKPTPGVCQFYVFFNLVLTTPAWCQVV